MLAVFFPWLAFLLRGRIFSAIFSFILWVILCIPMISTIFISDRSTFGDFLLAGFAVQIAWFFGSFLLWVVLTVWCCLVMYGDQRRKEMEQLIEVIEANSGKSLHYETQQANKTKKMWYLAIIFLISLAILAVFFIKREPQPSNNASNNQESATQKIDAKNPNSKNHKKSNSHSKAQNHSKCKNNKEAQAKER
ncbi:flagellar biosynthesis protein FlgG [Helicobacter pylori]|uniref:flagellar biosynthesis protein FlgG n=1 Tax=Helicobacter pylori TaxID=210 RepID=UPI00301647A5